MHFNFMKKIFRLYTKAFLMISLISIPFVFISFSDMNKMELTYRLWVSSFFPQLIYILYLFRKYNFYESFKDQFALRPFNFKVFILWFLMPFVIYVLFVNFNWIKVYGSYNWDINIICFCFLLFLSALLEEILFRFIPFQLLNGEITTKKIILISLFFSIFHLFNPNFNIIGIVNIVIVGVFFSFIYLKSNSILFVTIIHAIWNFSIGCILGSNVSGMKIISVLNYHPLKPSILSGGDFGFEGSIITTITLLFCLGILFNRKQLDYKSV